MAAFLPHANGSSSFWRQTPDVLDNHRSTPQLPTQADIVIIGAGYSGGSLVTHVLNDTASQGKSILVLDARQLCSGATGRNGGHLKPDAYNLISLYADRYGIDAAAEVADFEVANISAVRDFVYDNKVDCDFYLTRAVDVQLDAAHNEKLRLAHEKLVAKGMKAARDVFYIDGTAAEVISGVNGAKGAFTYTAGHVWPYKMVHYMFSRALEKGVNLQTNTPVTSIANEQDTQGFTAVETPRGTIRAKQIIVAANAYTASVLPEFKGRIIPYRGICSHIAPGVHGEKLPVLPNTYAIRFNEKDFDYLIPRADGSVVLGGARAAYIRNTESWYGSVDDSQVIQGVDRYFEGYMQRHFRGWENSGAKTTAVWSGIMGYSADHSPHIGHVPGRPGVFVMAGFTGHGMPQIFLAAKGISDMLFGASFAQTGMPQVFEATASRLASEDNWLAGVIVGLKQESR
ncbi:hypothetical protein TD95_000857 [Thielaviopsis punctulata]|uniref:FAD dependent oxidoreductase domain-containing protein n=1 Tax=Thielaviopsis punctulata TaxID=72032 RepID=A0A0F4ZKH2_9PEZI|nr:hypothetical protein TD95_000857 [Thielaviopsis punctulata]